MDWHNSFPNNSHQKESLAHGWFKYPSGHWGRKFHYGQSFTPPPAEPSLIRPYASFYLLTYMVGYYLLGCFSSMLERFAYLGHLGHLVMITVPIGLVIAGINFGALAHQIGNLFPAKWVPDRLYRQKIKYTTCLSAQHTKVKQYITVQQSTATAQSPTSKALVTTAHHASAGYLLPVLPPI
ncbi:hypothetical protein DSO57_1027573 [Entomophthora muscae]|uniref:Uncharacterized protein n=1 Tax=Entomophthora muscae TaxID=34485 RepID=A0ACC2SQS5_9FUNG|nr:hypothetical protein DSO57_1027573 [Entomophthora muscae]